MNHNEIDVAVTKPQEAIQHYLNALLEDATSLAEQEDLQLEQQTVAVPHVVKVAEIAEPEAPAPTVVAATQLAPSVDSAVAEQVQVIEKIEKSPISVWQENGRPSWAQERFECLLFDVAGLKLAVPLVELGTIYPLEGELTPLFGQPEWFLGLYKHPKRSIRVIDTARWVMPERYKDEHRDGVKYVISLQGCDWALAVHEVEQAVTLEPDAVRWRTGRGKRPWLAGTVVKEMCALLDVESLSTLIDQAQSTEQ